MKNKHIFLLHTVYGFCLILWILFAVLSGMKPTLEGPVYLYVLRPFLFGMTILPLCGAGIGFIISKKWGGLSSAMGKAIMALSSGLIAWAAGMIIWNFYLMFTDITVPYPSIADVFFVLSWPLWAYGVIKMAKAIGALFALRQTAGKLQAFLIPTVVSVFSYYLLIRIARGAEFDWGSGWSLFFNLFYPTGDLVILSLVIMFFFLSKKFLGGAYRSSILIIFTAFVMNYFSDFLFSYSTTTETYYNGHFVDLLFTTTMYCLSLGIAKLETSFMSES